MIDIFTLVGHSRSMAAQPSIAAPIKPGGVRALQDRVKTAARSYLSQGNAAIQEDWSEF